MRAALIREFAAPPEVGEFAAPSPEAGQLAIDVELAALNPVDRLIASGTFAHGAPPLPYIPGREGIARLDDGSFAYFDMPVPPYGAIAEQALVPEGSLHTLPAGLDPGKALACGVAGMAAWFSLKKRAALQPGERVLILGAGGAVGQVGLAVARKLGAGKIVAGLRDPSKIQGEADAAVSVAGTRDEVAKAISDAFDGEGPDLVLDPVWGVPAEAATEAMAFGGRLVQLGQSAGTEATFVSTAVRNKCLHVMGHTNFSHSQEERAEALAEMFSWTAAGDIDVAYETLPLDRVAEAWERQAAAPGLKLTIDPRS